jgi:DNA mismatch endonuclease, patch repair protein
MDTVDKATRSRIMSSVGRKNTGPEKSLRYVLHKAGLRYRLHDRALPGSPDLVFPRFRSVIFIHGCYWHSHGCYKSTVPKSRNEFWAAKFCANKLRDRRNVQLLTEKYWRVMVVWECAITGKSAYSSAKLAARIYTWLNASKPFAVIPERLQPRPSPAERNRSKMRV